ncbi:sucrose-6-phosphate hydrolase [Weissella hellenica]|uniref:Sucrose-6-phosphate hydrolase n=1 Tax=Weissella hellenica TaxID=46256 RepID=A0A4Y4G046_WEIHE|nr:sucrose-6-phosphate hydrolase [Weissella hellenica]NKY66643.1 sucrose-6-phosphate hydrolase [Weissella hellenica]GED35163.1 invertase [Weissella hellenica]SCB93894.1 beta-fructofuranosidase [Weissella hellenica]
MAWTREQRYRHYSSYSTTLIDSLEKQAATSQYKPKFHISPKSGLLNDPNGFSFFDGQWHVFYQAFPFGPVHGLKSWVHCVSNDLVHWQNLSIALPAGGRYDSHGAYSGSAQVIDNQLFLMYTGNVRTQDWQRESFQNGAWMDKDNHITKLTEPLIKQPTYVTDHFRDPQLLKINHEYYALIGAQDKKTLKGEIALFQSNDLKNWHDLGYVKHNLHDLGFMVECPNLVDVDGKKVLIFCPQGLPQDELKTTNIYPNVYAIADHFDFEQNYFEAENGEMVQLDEGFDVYASQAFNAPDGNAYLISWIGLPEIAYPTDKENWAHCLSMVKQLKIIDGQLYQQPVAAMSKLRDYEQKLPQKQRILIEKAGQQYELQLTLGANQTGDLLLASDGTTEHALQLKFNTIDGKLTVDRSNVGEKFGVEFGEQRQIRLDPNAPLMLDIFVDHSVCEIFVNDGQKVLTLRYFADESHTKIAFSDEKLMNYTGQYFALNDM